MGLKHLACGALAALLLLGAAPASACMNGIYLELDKPTKRINRAEYLVRAGEAVKAYRAAWKATREVRRKMKGYSRHETSNWYMGTALKRRARRVMAIAQLRASGKLSATGRLLGRLSKRRRHVKLRWARIVLKRYWAANRKSPVLRARYAEALAASPSKRLRARALKMLQALASKDLMPDAWAYRTLAQLHHARGDSKARDAALAKCRSSAGAKAAAICPAFSAPVARRQPTS